MEQHVICPYCGAESEGSDICPYCGNHLPFGKGKRPIAKDYVYPFEGTEETVKEHFIEQLIEGNTVPVDIFDSLKILSIKKRFIVTYLTGNEILSNKAILFSPSLVEGIQIVNRAQSGKKGRIYKPVWVIEYSYNGQVGQTTVTDGVWKFSNLPQNNHIINEVEGIKRLDKDDEATAGFSILSFIIFLSPFFLLLAYFNEYFLFAIIVNTIILICFGWIIKILYKRRLKRYNSSISIYNQNIGIIKNEIYKSALKKRAKGAAKAFGFPIEKYKDIQIKDRISKSIPKKPKLGWRLSLSLVLTIVLTACAYFWSDNEREAKRARFLQEVEQQRCEFAHSSDVSKLHLPSGIKIVGISKCLVKYSDSASYLLFDNDGMLEGMISDNSIYTVADGKLQKKIVVEYGDNIKRYDYVYGTESSTEYAYGTTTENVENVLYEMDSNNQKHKVANVKYDKFGFISEIRDISSYGDASKEYIHSLLHFAIHQDFQMPTKYTLISGPSDFPKEIKVKGSLYEESYKFFYEGSPELKRLEKEDEMVKRFKQITKAHSTKKG